jgi:hypothetical protein
MKVLSFCTFDSSDQMEHYIKSTDLATIRLGYDQSRFRKFYCVQARFEQVTIIIAIKSFGIGIEPKWAEMERQIIVGYNDRVTFIRANAEVTERSVDLLTLFVEFLAIRKDGKLVVLCETAVVGLGSAGEELWRYDTDLISDYRLDGDILHLKYLDAAATYIDIEKAFSKAPVSKMRF